MKVKTLQLLISLFLLAAFVPPAFCLQKNDLGVCLADSLSGKERKELATWIYFAIAAHPEIEKYSNIPPAERLKTDKEVGSLITRLLTKDCAAEFAEAQKTDSLAINQAFEYIGGVAVQEILRDERVQKAIANYANYVDKAKIVSILKK